jgi:hypothetical protein
MDLLAIDIPDRALARKITHVICDQMEQGWIGRHLPRLSQQVELLDIFVEGRVMPLDYAFFQTAFGGLLQRIHATGALSTEELTNFWSALDQTNEGHCFYAGATGFVVSGRKP